MRALLIGGGGREHAIGLSLVKSGTELVVISPNKNPGLLRIAKELIIGDENDRDFVLQIAQRIAPDYVFIGPESPLARGVSDVLLKNKFKVFAPSSISARLETSKSYLRGFMSENGLRGNIEGRAFSDPREAEDFIKEVDYNFVIKPDGLTGGKGVMVQGAHFQKKEDGIRITREYLDSGMRSVLVEKKMTGEEFSLQAFVKGAKIYFLPLVQDYKRGYENDEGPNTGGMGSIYFSERGLPFISSDTTVESRKIMSDLVKKFSEKVEDYVGPIFGGFIATKEGPKLLEINARLGDPEAMNVLSLMENSIQDVAMDILNNQNPNLEFRDKINVLRYLVPKGYGSRPVPSTIDLEEEKLLLRGLRIYYASVNLEGKHLKQTTSRSLALLSEGTDIHQITARFDDLSLLLKGEYGMRRDIGTESMIESKKEAMRTVIN